LGFPLGFVRTRAHTQKEVLRNYILFFVLNQFSKGLSLFSVYKIREGLSDFVRESGKIIFLYLTQKLFHNHVGVA
jgi:hypothetical protein